MTVQPYWVLVAIVQFPLLFFLLQKCLWGPIKKTLQARAERIREGLETAEAAKRERADMKLQVERLLAEARREAAALSERAAQAAEAAAAEIRAQAKQEGDRIRERPPPAPEQLHQQALSQPPPAAPPPPILAARPTPANTAPPKPPQAL